MGKNKKKKSTNTDNNATPNNNNNNNNSTAQPKNLKNENSKEKASQYEKKKTLKAPSILRDLKQLSHAIELDYDPRKGRFLKATTDFKPGDLIFKNDVMLASSKTQKFSGNVRYCFACDDIRHEGKDCIMYKKKYSPLKTLIDAYAQNKFGSHDAIGALIHFYARVGSSDTSRKNPLWDLFELEINPNFDVDRIFKAWPRVEADLKLFDSLVPTDYKFLLTLDEQKTFVNIFITNKHELQEKGQIGLFSVVSLLEHNCFPNCNIYCVQSTMIARAKTEIKKGDSLSISYLDIIMPTKARQQSLFKNFGFTCSCSRCMAPRDPTRAFWCTVCSGIVLPNMKGEKADDFICMTKGCKVPEDVFQRMMDEENRYSSAQALIQLPALASSTLLDYRHWIIFSRFHSEVIRNIYDPSQRSTAIVSCVKMAKTIETVEGPNHPETAGLYSSIAQGYYLLRDYPNAYKAYMRAAEAFKVCCGEDSKPYIGMKKKAHEIRQVFAPDLDKANLGELEKKMLVEKRSKWKDGKEVQPEKQEEQGKEEKKEEQGKEEKKEEQGKKEEKKKE